MNIIKIKRTLNVNKDEKRDLNGFKNYGLMKT